MSRRHDWVVPSSAVGCANKQGLKTLRNNGIIFKFQVVIKTLAFSRKLGASPGGGHFHIRPVGGLPTFRVSIFSKNFRTGYKISVKITE